MKDKIELLKSWINTGQVVTQQGRNIDDLMTLVNQIELSSLGGEEKTLDLKERSNKIDLLEAYSLFLEKNGYLDTDWRAEEPFAIDEFLKLPATPVKSESHPMIKAVDKIIDDTAEKIWKAAGEPNTEENDKA